MCTPARTPTPDLCGEAGRGVGDGQRLRVDPRLPPARAAVPAAQALQPHTLRGVPALALPLVRDLPDLPQAGGAAALTAECGLDRRVEGLPACAASQIPVPVCLPACVPPPRLARSHLTLGPC